MNNASVFLRQNIQVEPLVDHWYAWSHLIPPATAARNITERHLKIMDSYISAPQIHANAVGNPKMAGGPFIDYGGVRVDEIRELRNHTKQHYSHLIKLSEAIGELDNLLRTKAKGASLQPFYSEIPAILRGYVELVYDLNNHPAFRLIEPLIYRSEFYDRSAQSLMLSVLSNDSRPFVLSTPRLPEDGIVHWNIPFSSQAIDALFQLKQVSQPRSHITNLLVDNGKMAAALEPFLTENPPPLYTPYDGNGIRWRYFGHACILIETAHTTMLFDPVLSYTYEAEISRYTYLDLPEHIDYVLITHNHQDHVLLETLLQIRHKVSTIVVPKSGGGALQDPSLRLTLENIGFRNVVELGELDSITSATDEIVGVPFLGEHSDLDIRTKLAYMVRCGRHKLLFAADSCNIEPQLYQHLHHAIGDVDVLFLGMECDGAPLTWLYGPLLTHKLERQLDESRRLAGSNFAQGMDIVSRFNCRECYVYAMGQEPWLNYVMSLKYTPESRPITESNRLIEECKTRGIVAERLFGEKEILIEA